MQQSYIPWSSLAIKSQWFIGISLILFTIPFGKAALISTGIGTGIFLFTNTICAIWVFHKDIIHYPKHSLNQLYITETVRIILMSSLFAVTLATQIETKIIFLFGSYLSLQIIPTLFNIFLSI